MYLSNLRHHASGTGRRRSFGSMGMVLLLTRLHTSSANFNNFSGVTSPGSFSCHFSRASFHLPTSLANFFRELPNLPTSPANFSSVTSRANFSRVTSPANFFYQLFESYIMRKLLLPTRELLHLPTSPANCWGVQHPKGENNRCVFVCLPS